MNIEELEKGTVSDLQSVFKAHSGNNALNFMVYDHSDKIKLNMPSRKQKVKISQELLNELDGLEVKYKLN